MSNNNVNILAERYASSAMKSIWGAEGRVLLERDYWIAVLKAQKSLGLDIPDAVIEKYESVKDQVDLESIQKREAVTRHDVKARIEEFCALAGHEHIHKGLTSRDLTENVEQLQILRGLELIRTKAMAALNKIDRFQPDNFLPTKKCLCLHCLRKLLYNRRNFFNFTRPPINNLFG